MRGVCFDNQVSADLIIRDIANFFIFKGDHANNKTNACNNDWIPKPGKRISVRIAGGLASGIKHCRYEGCEAPENSIPNVIGQ